VNARLSRIELACLWDVEELEFAELAKELAKESSKREITAFSWVP